VEIAILLIALVIVLVILRKLKLGGNSFGRQGSQDGLKSRNTSHQVPKVRVNRYFVSDREQRFFHTLKDAVGEQGHVLTLVALNRLIYLPRTGRQHMSWFNKISRRSVDFLVVDRKTPAPQFALELDDSSHQQQRREKWDDEVNRICVAAGLRLIRVPGSCTRQELREMIFGQKID